MLISKLIIINTETYNYLCGGTYRIIASITRVNALLINLCHSNHMLIKADQADQDGRLFIIFWVNICQYQKWMIKSNNVHRLLVLRKCMTFTLICTFICNMPLILAYMCSLVNRMMDAIAEYLGGTAVYLHR